MRSFVLALAVLLLLLPECQTDLAPVPERCDTTHNSDAALEAWLDAHFRRDRVKLHRATGCLTEGCDFGVTASCSDLRGLCLMPDTQNDEALTKRGVCSMPRVLGSEEKTAK